MILVTTMSISMMVGCANNATKKSDNDEVSKVVDKNLSSTETEQTSKQTNTNGCIEIDGNFTGKVISVENGIATVEVDTYNIGDELGEIVKVILDGNVAVVGDTVTVFYNRSTEGEINSVIAVQVEL